MKVSSWDSCFSQFSFLPVFLYPSCHNSFIFTKVFALSSLFLALTVLCFDYELPTFHLFYFHSCVSVCVCGNAAVRMRPSLRCLYRWWFVFSLSLALSLMVFSLAPCLPSLSRSFLHNHLFKRFLAVPGGSNYRHRQAL